MIAAPTILFAFYVWIPIIENIYISFFETKGMKVKEFIGFENYAKVLRYGVFQKAATNTLVYVFWSLIIGFVVPMILAVLISETVHCKSFFRFAVYFPNIVPIIAATLIWRYFFLPSDTGVLNILLSKIGVEPQLWLNVKEWTIPLIVIVMTWKAAGSTALIYMASISGISPELYEAATIDGAGIFRRIWYITLPNIFSLAKTLLILQVISVFQILVEPMFLTDGGPNNASISIMQLVWRYAFQKSEMGKASALSVLISLMLVILSAIYMYATREREPKARRARRS